MDADGKQALAGFRRFPTWMWRNTDVVDFIEWLRNHNASLQSQEPRIGFYGLDLYSLFTSTDEVLRYLDKVGPEAAQRARSRYACFDHFGEDSQRYGYAAGFDLSASCENEVVAQLRDLQARDRLFATRWAGGDRCIFLCEAKRPAFDECRRILSHHVPPPRLLLELA